MTHHRIAFRRKHDSEQEQVISVPAGMRLNEALVQAGVPLRTHCGGAGTCGKCQVVINDQNVLACQTTVESDLDVVVPDASLRIDEQNVIVQTKTSPRILARSTRNGGKGMTGHRYGMAVDIGTTMLAAELHDFMGHFPVQTASRINPQRQFGDDVMTRIQKIMENPSALTAMQQLVTGAINEMVVELTEESGLVPHDITIMVVAGNTTMQSILFGIDPTPLGESPFHAPVNEFPPCRGRNIGLTMNTGGTVEALPIFGGFVGGDIVAGVLTLLALQSSMTPKFLLDIGTNGEIVLAHQGELFTAATAAGPAFEGATIEFGTLAVPGAIERVEMTSGNITVSTIGDKPAVGIGGSGLIDAVAVLLEQKIILPNGRFAEKQSYVELVSAAESGIGEAILLTQKDIRELQLASGAIRAGVTLLLRENNVLLEEIETFYVAGGFGQSIRLSSARRIGLLPALPSDRFEFCGNTSLAGARRMLLNPENAAVVRRFVQQSHHYELATLPQFQEVFAKSMRWE